MADRDSEIAVLWGDVHGETGRMRKVLLDLGEGAVLTSGGMYGGGLRIILTAVPAKGQEGEPESLGILYFDKAAEEKFREALGAR